jgi:ferredoxin-nitrate reductase
VKVSDGRVTSVRGNPEARANLGRICPKGALIGETITTPDRLTTPLLRIDGGGVFVPISWDEALDVLAGRIREVVARSGPDALAFYGSGQLDTETWYAAGKLFKGALGTNNTDSNSRLCMASAVAGYRTSLGSDGPPACYEDIDLADVVFIVGANMAEAHPVLFDRLKARKRRDPAVTIIAVDPRRTPTAAFADIHVPIAPGGDIPFLNALAAELIAAGRADRDFIAAHTDGYAEFADHVAGTDIDAAARLAGLDTAAIREVAHIIGGAGRLLSLYCMGMNQSTVGMWKNNSLINLHLLLGQIGRPGAGPFSLTGQPNAMGGREAGALAHMLPGYRLVESAEHRAEVEAAWGLSPGSIAPAMGLTAVEMFRAMERGAIELLWVAGTNPAVSMPDLNQAQRALTAGAFVVVQDIYHPTETTRYANLVLPVAQWGEKEGTSTNSERTVSLSPAFLAPPGEARSDFWILTEMGRRLAPELFPWGRPADAWEEYRMLTAGRPCDQVGITRRRLEAGEAIQWPCPSEGHPGTPRLYLDHRFPTPDGRARFLPRDYRAPREETDHEFPLVLVTGRVAAHWHSRTRTARVPKLDSREPDPFIEIHPEDATERNLAEGDMAAVSSRRGSIRARVRITPRVRRGVVFVPFHWGDLYGKRTAANYLTNPVIGRISREPEFKYCAVQVELAPRLPAEPGAPNRGIQAQLATLPTARASASRVLSNPLSFVRGRGEPVGDVL